MFSARNSEGKHRSGNQRQGMRPECEVKKPDSYPKDRETIGF